MASSKFISKNKPQGISPLLIILFAIAVVIRLWNISRPLQGDEYNSLETAVSSGSQLNGWLYYSFLSTWVKLGKGDWWLRVPSILFGMAAIPLAYWIGKLADNKRLGLILATLVAFSPFAIELGMRVRHYSLYLSASLLAFATFLYLLDRPSSRTRRLVFGGSLVILILSHLFGVILAIALLTFFYLEHGARPDHIRRRILLVGAGVLLMIIAISVPESRAYGWNWLLDAVGALSRVEYESARGLSIAQIAKIPIVFYVFGMGYKVYPLNLWIALPGILGFLVVGSASLIALRRKSILILIVSVLCIVPIVLLIIEPIVPPFSETVGPRHVVAAWPAFILLVAVGAARLWRGPLGYLLVIIALASAMIATLGDWSYGLGGPDWRTSSELATKLGISDSIVLFDGRSSQAVEFYFPEEIARLGLWDYPGNQEKIKQSKNILLLTNDFKAGNRANFNSIFADLEASHMWNGGRVDYPYFEYVLAKKDRIDEDYPVVSNNGQIRQPLRLYGIEFQDLELPVVVAAGEEMATIHGAFFVPDLKGQSNQRIPLNGPQYGQNLILLSNLLEGEQLPKGTLLAELTIGTESGEERRYPIRLGVETASWDSVCYPEDPCETIHRWHKKVALTGQRAYIGAWRDFDAGIHAAELRLHEPVDIDNISVDYVADSGQLYVWGMVISDD